ncbi:MAG: hypothetical protein OSB58_14090 [Alphaproteobacteria bacterium]|nr:hypothetical protein [Alphaproteobacteria bacterium]
MLWLWALAQADRPNLNLTSVGYFLPYAKTADRKHALKGLQLAGLGD